MSPRLLLTGVIAAAALAACTSTTTGSITTVTTSDNPSGAAQAATAAPVQPAASSAPTDSPANVLCVLVYQDHNASISFTAPDALAWCDRVRGADGHWFRALAPPDTGSLRVDLLCNGSTPAGGYWVVMDTGSDQYGKAGCVLLNQLGLPSPMEN
jgi:hypothetical protein